MKLLGAIIAGGRGLRFGGDKGAALLGGKALIDHVADALGPQVDMLVVCGRDWPGMQSVADRPAPDLGPLGGLNAALHVAQQTGFDAVLTASCDVLPVPMFVRCAGEFGDDIGVVAGQLDHHLATQPDRSLRHWIAASGAREFDCATHFHNLNTREDFTRFSTLAGWTI